MRYVVMYLEKPTKKPYSPNAVPDAKALLNTLQPCDILLIEGDLRYSEVIKYATQSTWSHCALYIGNPPDNMGYDSTKKYIIEVLLSSGTVLSPISDYYGFNSRIMRPVGLSDDDKKQVIQYCLNKLGHRYDMLNVINLLKHHVPFAKLFFGKLPHDGIFAAQNSERVICSSLIAQAFEYINYPILPDTEKMKKRAAVRDGALPKDALITEYNILKKRHYSLFSPRDFDVSPFFNVVKPTIESGFDYKNIKYHNENDEY